MLAKFTGNWQNKITTQEYLSYTTPERDTFSSFDGMDPKKCKEGIPMDQILEQGLISPATCCLVNEDGEKTVEKAFQLTNFLSQTLREKYKLA